MRKSTVSYRRHPAWIRRVAAGLVVPLVLLCVDAHKLAWAYRQDRAQRQRLLEIAKKQNLDPEMLLDPATYQKHEGERAKARRAKAVAEAEALSRPDPAKLKAAQDERDAVKRAYAPVELASIAKDIEGLRATLTELDNANGNRQRRESALRSIDGYARILADAHEVLARYDAAERTRLATLPASIRARHDKFMREAAPTVNALRTSLSNLVNFDSTQQDASLMRVRNDLARMPPAPHKLTTPDHGFAMRPATFAPLTPRNDPAEIQKIAPSVMTPARFDEIQKTLRQRLGIGGIRGIFKVPAFLTALLSGPGSTDLNSTDEAPRSDDIVAQASALSNDPIQIYNFVHDNILTEVYYGSKKGARGTLMERAGNDFDQASLLIALLRASGFPARYEIGSVVLTPEQAMGFTGTETPAAAASALVSSGFPAQQLATGNTVTGVQMELTWVRAYVRYSDYRGRAIGTTGDNVWAHLAPSIKRYESTAKAVDLRDKVPFDFDSYLSREQKKSPVDTWEDQIRAYIQANLALNCTTLDAAQKTRVPIDDRLPLLPETLPAAVVQRLAVFSDVPTIFKHTVDIVGKSSSGVLEADYRASVAAMYGKPLAVIFDAATAADQATLSSHGGLANTPPYLVQLKPTLYSGDQPLAIGRVGDTPGQNQSWQVILKVPNLAPEQPLEHLFSVGGVYAIVLDPGTLPGKLVDDALSLEQQFRAANMSEDFLSAARLVQLGRRYFAEFDRGRDRVSEQYWSRYFKDTYEGSFGIAIRGQTANGIPVMARQNLVNLDVTRLTTTPYSVDGSHQYSGSITRLTGHNSSYLEHSTPQAFFGPNQWSAVRLLGNAAQSGQTIFKVDSSNVASILARLAVPDAVSSDIEDQVNRGRVVRIHSLPIMAPNLPPQWGYIPEDLVTGEGAYRINAELNGGDGELDRLDSDTEPNGPTCPTCDRGNAPAGSEVDVATGVYSFDELDLIVPSIGAPVMFQRKYRSQDPVSTSDLGPGWHHSFADRIVDGGSSTIGYVDCEGVSWSFRSTDGMTFNPPPGLFQTIRHDNGGYVMQFPTGDRRVYSTDGYLVAIRDSHNHTVTIERSGSLINRVLSADSQIALTVVHNTDGRIGQVTDLAGHVVSFEYDGNGRLALVRDANGNSRYFAYDLDNLMIRKTDYLGNAWSMAYDAAHHWRSTTDPLGHVRNAQYNWANRRTAFTDELGRVTVYEYDDHSTLTGLIDALGNRTVLERDSSFNVVRTTDSRGYISTTQYDSTGNPTVQVTSDGAQSQYTYNNQGRVLTFTDAAGGIIANTYDDAGNLVISRDPSGRTVTIGYANDVLTSISSNGNTTSFGRDSRGMITSIRDAEGNESVFTYDPSGRRVSATDPDGNISTYTYDAKGNVTTISTPDGTYSREYDANGRLLAQVDPSNHRYAFHYDGAGRRIAIVDESGGSTSFNYDPAGQLVGSVTPRGAKTLLAYDSAGRRTAITDPMGGTTTFGFCAALSVHSPCVVVDPTGVQRRLEYDGLGRLVSITDPFGGTTAFTYDANGRIQNTDRGGGRATKREYDSAGRMVAVTDEAGGITSYVYDDSGRIQSITDASQRTHQFSYDRAGRRASQTFPDGQSETYKRTPGGDLAKLIFSDGAFETFTYDAQHRIASVATSDGSQSSFAYDFRGQVTEELNATVDRRVAYDERGRMTQVDDNRLGAIRYTYDFDDRLTSMSEPDGTTTSYERDISGRLVSIKRNGRTFSFAYDEAGRRTGLVYPNGVTVVYHYDSFGRPDAITWSHKHQTFKAVTYSYDNYGRRLRRIDSDGSSDTYEYDLRDQLTRVGHTSIDDQTNSTVFTYDAIGNRVARLFTTPAGTQAVTTYDYDARGHLASQSDGITKTTFTYDARGNLAAREAAGQPAVTFVHDIQGRLTNSTAGPKSNVWSYDAEGQLAAVNGSAILLERITATEIGHSDASGNPTRFVVNPDMIDEVLEQDDATGILYLLNDDLESPIIGSDESGNVMFTRAYDAFGGMLSSAQGSTSVGFDGRRFGAETDRLGGGGGRIGNYRARWYDPEIGRFLEPDPVHPWSLPISGTNEYAYARNNPITSRDPAGALDTATTTFVRDPALFIEVMLAMGVIIAAVATTSICLRNKGIEQFYRGDSLLRATIVVETDSFLIAGIGTVPGELGSGLYITRSHEDAAGFAFEAIHKGLGRGALMGIQIASLTWQLLVGMGAQDEVPMTKGGIPTGLQSFVPFPLMPIFDMASTKQILVQY